VGVARGKRNVDKRDDIAKRDATRDMERAVADRYRRGLG
jgi:tmRNA-binding protein